jgi:hypothetical protein
MRPVAEAMRFFESKRIDTERKSFASAKPKAMIVLSLTDVRASVCYDATISRLFFACCQNLIIGATDDAVTLAAET